MSYRPNQSQQLSIFDRSLRLTERERKCLEKSWAKVFSDEIFPAIDEDRSAFFTRKQRPGQTLRSMSLSEP